MVCRAASFIIALHLMVTKKISARCVCAFTLYTKVVVRYYMSIVVEILTL